MSANESDAVGYKRPPKKGQFQKGLSGNPGGRRKPLEGANSALAQALARRVTVSDEGGQVRMTMLEALFRTLVDKAMTGDPRVLKLLFDRLKTFERHSDDRFFLKQLCEEAEDEAVQAAARSAGSPAGSE